MALSRALLVSLSLQISYLCMLKTLSPIDHLAALPGLALFLWTVASIAFALKARRRNRIEQLPSVDTLQIGSSDIQKGFGSTYIYTKTGEYTESEQKDQNKNDSENDTRFGLKLVVTMVLAIPCALLLLAHVRLIAGIHDGSWDTKRTSLQASDSTGLQEVFQVYQPVSLTSHGASGCNLDVLLMDHVFGASYGKPFVGEDPVIPGLLLGMALTYGTDRRIRATPL